MIFDAICAPGPALQPEHGGGTPAKAGPEARSAYHLVDIDRVAGRVHDGWRDGRLSELAA